MTERRKTIGGFFPIELPKGAEYHRQALRLNSARYALEYLLRVRNYQKIYLPAYLCDSVLQPVKRLNIAYSFYSIGEDFAPIFDHMPEEYACFLYVNYFGVNAANAAKICRRMKNVIIDNTQAFFAMPYAHIDTLYSPRKFFGVPDGGYLYTDAEKRFDLKQDVSYYRYDALLKQIDLGSDAALPLFVENEAYLDHCGMLVMSRLTRRLLQSVDYQRVLVRRNENFRFLHEQIGRFNQLPINLDELNGPMCYPFLITRGAQLKEALLKQRIYVNDYWDEVLTRVSPDSFEHHLVKDLVPLPIDQHCNRADLLAMVQIIREFLA
ncbi:MAG: hypothetical protein ABF651_11215 [Sporolactobacillus sp.]